MNFLDTFIVREKEVLEEKFGIKPEKTELVYHNKNSWKDFLKKRKTKASGIFLPRSLEAHMPENTGLAELTHEYFGHGLFCEHTLKGKKIVEYEQELASLEEKILGKQLEEFPKNTKIGIFQNSHTTKLIKVDKKIENPEFKKYDYVFLAKDNGAIEQYLNLKKKSDKFFLETLPLYEGSAIWIEDFLLNKIDKVMWNERKKKIKRNQEYSWYKQLKNFEKNNGTYFLWFSLGFPKVFRKDILTNIIKEKTKERFGKIRYAILYGSKKPSADIDFLLVLDDNTNARDYIPQDIDILEIKEEEFMERTKLLDLQFTEPLFTGDLIIGNEKEFSNLRNYILKIRPNNSVITYLRNRAEEYHRYALQFDAQAKKEEKKEPKNFYTFCSLLDFSFYHSYRTFANEYEKQEKPLKLEKVIFRDAQLSNALQKAKEFKNKIKKN